MVEVNSEIEETQQLIAIATYPGLKAVLESYLLKLKTSEKKVETNSVSELQTDDTLAAATKPAAPAPKVARTMILPSLNFIPIESFSWDQGSYNSPVVSVFVDIPEVGTVKDNVEFSCTPMSFDLKVTGLNGKSYRLVKDNLEKDIIPNESKIIVKKDKVVIKLQKKKGEYSYESWTNLTGKKPRAVGESDKKKDPMGGIMDMMKDMYDDGDDNMKKIIGEAMMKSQRGEKSEPPSFNDDL